MIRFLSYSIFIVALCFSCRSYQYPDAVGIRPENAKEVNTFFLDTSKTLVYRTKIDVFKKHINGSSIVKTVAPTEHRVALVNDFGQTLFDISILTDSYMVHYIAPDIAKPRVEKLIVNIFRTITERRFANSALIFREKQHYPVYVVGDSYYKLKGNVVDNIVGIKGAKEEFVVDFNSNDDSVLTQIDVQHKKYPLKINMVLDNQDE